MKLKELERKVAGHDINIHNVFEAIRKLMREDEKPKRKIGLHEEGVIIRKPIRMINLFFHCVKKLVGRPNRLFG